MHHLKWRILYRCGTLLYLENKNKILCKVPQGMAGSTRHVKRISDSMYRIQGHKNKQLRQVVHFDRLKPCNPGKRNEIEAQQQLVPDNDHLSHTTRIIEPPAVDKQCVINATDEDDFERVSHREVNELATTERTRNEQVTDSDEHATVHQDAEIVGDMGQPSELDTAEPNLIPAVDVTESRRYPTRQRQEPDRYGSYVSH